MTWFLFSGSTSLCSVYHSNKGFSSLLRGLSRIIFIRGIFRGRICPLTLISFIRGYAPWLDTPLTNSTTRYHQTIAIRRKINFILSTGCLKEKIHINFFKCINFTHDFLKFSILSRLNYKKSLWIVLKSWELMNNMKTYNLFKKALPGELDAIVHLEKWHPVVF